jgi:hypothetical protein
MSRLATVALSLGLLLAGAALPALAHVTPNVELMKKGEFIQQSLPGATRFFEEKLVLSSEDRAAIRLATGWAPGEDDAKVYVGRDAQGRRIGTVAIVWMPSQHGPVGVGIAFGPDGKLLRTAVTDVGSEPLAWVRPLLEGDGLAPWSGLALDAKPDPLKIAPAVTGAMNRYYAEVIAGAVGRGQALVRVSLATEK